MRPRPPEDGGCEWVQRSILFNDMFRHLIISAVIFALEAAVGVGLLGIGIGMVMMLVGLASAIRPSEKRWHYLGVAVVYASLCVSTIGVIVSNWRVAQHRAAPVISAIERFHSEQGRYPGTLNELCPAYLPSIPKPGFTLLSRRYGYIADRPQLYFPAMFHGIVAYDFATHNWTTND
jgi:hypothetical protein